MTKTFLTLTIVTAATLAPPAAFAAQQQPRPAAASRADSKHSSVRQAYGAVRSHDAAGVADSMVVSRPPAQPGAW